MFNKEQQEVINTIEGALIVSASAGTGKTSTLVARVENMVASGINQEDIMITTFTNESATDLKGKLSEKGIEFCKVGTFHSICRSILVKEGINVDKRPPANYIFQNEFKSLRLSEKIFVKDILGWIGYQKNYGLDSNAETFMYKDMDNYNEYELRMYFKQYEEIMKKNKCYDFEDWMIETIRVLVQDCENKHTTKYLMVDEYQDSNKLQEQLIQLLCPSGNICVVGDEKQCLVPTTLIETTEGTKRIDELSIDDEIIVANGRGKTISTNPTKITKKMYNGNIITIKTESGKIIKSTPNHMFFVNERIEKPFMIYLMYKKEWGFRIGFSQQYNKKSTYTNGFNGRAVQEQADRVWCIDTYELEEEARYFEMFYAYKYGIPLYMFNCDNRTNIGLSNEKSKQLFNDLDTYNKGLKLLNDLNMYFEYPHFIPNRATNKVDISINFTLFGSNRESKGVQKKYKGNLHELNYFTTDFSFEDESKHILDNIYHKHNGEGLEFIEGRKCNGNADELHDIANKLADLREGNILRRRAMISKEKTKMIFYPASNIKEGMKLGIYNNETRDITEELVIEVYQEQYNGYVYDVNVDEYRNYIANNICVHNCLYGFRGSSPAIMTNFLNIYPDAKVVKFKTNYRSCKNLVEQGNVFSRIYFGNSPLYADAEAFNQEDGVISQMSYIDEEAQAYHLVQQIKGWIEEGVEPNEIAVLYRKNKCAFEIENELKKNDICYHITGNTGSFFERTEPRIFLAVLRLIQNTNDDSAVEELMDIRVGSFKWLSKPARRKLEEFYIAKDISLFKACELYSPDDYNVKRNLGTFVQHIKDLVLLHNNGVDLYSIINKIQVLFEVNTFVEEKYDSAEDVEERLESIESFKKFVKGNTLQSFISFVYSDIEMSKSKKKLTRDDVRLMSIHASKGLEFQKVILLIKDGTFPDTKHEDSFETEVNCMYVACTRAKEQIYISEISTCNKFAQEYLYGEQ